MTSQWIPARAGQLVLALTIISLCGEQATCQGSSVDAVVPEPAAVLAAVGAGADAPDKDLYKIEEEGDGAIAIVPAGSASGSADQGFELPTLSDSHQTKELQWKNAALQKQVQHWKAVAKKTGGAKTEFERAMASIAAVRAKLSAGKWKGKAGEYQSNIAELAQKVYTRRKWKGKAQAESFRNAVGDVKALTTKSVRLASALKEVEQETGLLKVVDASRKKWKGKALHMERVIKQLSFKQVLSNYKKHAAPAPTPAPPAANKPAPVPAYKPAPKGATDAASNQKAYQKFMSSHHLSYANYLKLAKKFSSPP